MHGLQCRRIGFRYPHCNGHDQLTIGRIIIPALHPDDVRILRKTLSDIASISPQLFRPGCNHFLIPSFRTTARAAIGRTEKYQQVATGGSLYERFCPVEIGLVRLLEGSTDKRFLVVEIRRCLAGEPVLDQRYKHGVEALLLSGLQIKFGIGDGGIANERPRTVSDNQEWQALAVFEITTVLRNPQRKSGILGHTGRKHAQP